ncbi:MAG TPA: hypothetical protein VEC58_05770, partial [Roseiarcus sp.]|nr:hypothetical protein [Roseiarcus sp.]
MNSDDPKGVDATQVAALLAGTPFAAAFKAGAALLALALDPLHIYLANEEAMALLGARDLAELEAITISAESPGARRLRLLARTLTSGAPRQQRLRFFAGRRSILTTLACARLVDGAGRAYLVAAATTPAQESASLDALAASSFAALADPTHPEPERFLWRVDQHLRFGAPTAALVAALGAHAPQPDESLGALKTRTGLDEDGRLAAALAAKTPFSGLRLAWPQGGGKAPKALIISGAPIFDAGRRFMGFRGSGQFVAPPAIDVGGAKVSAFAATTTENKASGGPPAETLQPAGS